MSWCEIWINLAINLTAGVIIFFAGFFWPMIPKSIKAYRFKKFFGSSVNSDRFAIVYGTLQDPRPRLDDKGNPLFRFQKQLRDGRIISVVGPFENIVGDCEIRASGYLAQNIGKAREKTIKILSDIRAYDDLEFTLISLGSPTANHISAFAMRQPSNKFYQFAQEN